MEFTFEQGNEEYEKGNYETAFKIFMLLAESGEMRAQISIACMYETGEGVQQDLTKSIKWYRLAAEQGHPVAQNNLAVVLLDADPKDAIQWLFAAAENNFPFAQSMLGDIYCGFYNLPSDIRANLNDISEAIKWYQKAGESGFSYADYRLGEIFSSGQGVELDEKQATKYYFSAAKQGYEPAQEVLSQAYTRGLLGLQKDIERADYWRTQAQQGKGKPLN